jgi:pyruvate carboxylase
VGYTNYPDNVVRAFVKQAATSGVDVFRVFDSLNWVENMRVAIDAVLESGALCEGTVCYTADLFDTSRPKYGLKYYVDIARQLQHAGVHTLAIKDMAGVCRPRAAKALVKALKEETGLPIHFHTHDTSGAAAASVLAAIEAGCDVVDGALDSMSGLTSQPNLSAIAAALAGTECDPGLDPAALHAASTYFEGVRRFYAPFESEIRSGTADVYRHEMPGGQYTNLREQARSLGLAHRWSEVSQAYADVNQLFGDIVKVTPTSKVVGDMALMMVASDLTPADVLDPARDIAFPESVVQLFNGELGFPPDGFPEGITRKALRLGAEDSVPAAYRPGDRLPPVDLEAIRTKGEQECGQPLDEQQLSSYLMYPKQMREFCEHQQRYGDTSQLPTPVFFYGPQPQQEIAVEIDPGKTLLVALQSVSPDGESAQKVQFELNGQARTVRVQSALTAGATTTRPLADPSNPWHVAAPMPGAVVAVAVQPGQTVQAGDTLLAIEAMKMETHICAERNAVVETIFVSAGDRVDAKALLIVLKER